VDILNNLATCHIKLGDNPKAKEVSCSSLEIDLSPTNMKGILLAAKSCINLGDFEEGRV